MEPLMYSQVVKEVMKAEDLQVGWSRCRLLGLRLTTETVWMRLNCRTSSWQPELENWLLAKKNILYV